MMVEWTASVAALWQRILRVDHASLFVGAAGDIKDRDHGFDRLPQPGFIGCDYRPGGVLLLGQNPGSDPKGKGMSPSDQLQYRLLSALRDASDNAEALAAFKNLMSALGVKVMPHWAIARNVVQPLLNDLGVNLNQVAYTNMVKFRTNDSGFANTLYEKSWELTSEQIDLLSPSIIVALGVATHRGFMKRYRGRAKVYKITRGIGDTFLPAAGKSDIAAICAAERDRFV